MRRGFLFSFIILLIIALPANQVSGKPQTVNSPLITGAACGKVLLNLFTLYRTTGKVDLKNTNTLLNVLELSTYYNALKGNANNNGFKTDFATGLITGSKGLVTAKNSLATITSLLAIPALGGFNKNVSTASTTATNITTGLVNLFKMLKP